jgi:uncharacterized membrane-anchored protein
MIRIALILLGLFLCAWKFATGFLAGQTIRTQGEEVLFELAPVDPRALFLGDYMTLNYDFGLRQEDGERIEVPNERRGTAVLKVEDGVARVVRFDRLNDLAADERLIHYTKNRWPGMSIGGERYYFQSGTGERFEAAEYGIFRVMPDGRALLMGLADEKKRPILIAGEAPGSVLTMER